MKRAGLSFALVLCLAACGPRPPITTTKASASQPVASSAGASQSQSPLAVEGSTTFPEGDLALVGDDRQWHDRARDAVASGDLYLAKRILLRLVSGYRKSTLLIAQHEWLQRRIDEESKGAREALEKAKLEAVPLMPLSFRLGHAAPGPARPIPRLAIGKSTRNAVTDEDRWFESVGPTRELELPPPETRIIVHLDFTDPSSEDVLQRLTLVGWLETTPSPRFKHAVFPSWIPKAFGTAGLSRVVESDAHVLVTYGDRYLAVFDNERKLVRMLDLFLLLYPESHVRRAPIKVGELRVTTSEGSATSDLSVKDRGPRHDVQWADVRDGVLYLSTRYNGYAKEVKGQHAQISAIDLTTGDVLFRSDPLTSNGADFLLVDGGIITGYGFTSEPDFVFCLDAKTGKTVQKIPVPSAPEHFAWDEASRRVFVRTYDHDLVLTLK